MKKLLDQTSKFRPTRSAISDPIPLPAVVGWGKGVMYLMSPGGGGVGSNWYWLTVGQGLLSLQQVMVEEECLYFFCSFVPLFCLLYYLVSLLPFSGKRHKMTHKGWRVDKLQLNQFVKQINILHVIFYPYCAASADDILILFLYFPGNRLWHFMQIASLKYQSLFSRYHKKNILDRRRLNWFF